MPHIHEKYDFTVSAFILHPTENKILLHKHLKLGRWLQPGGHVELDEDPLQALNHELLEETGLRLEDCELLLQPNQPQIQTSAYSSLPIPFHKMVHDFYPDGSHKHIDDGYLIRSNTEKIKPADGESQEWGWFDIDEIRKLYEDKMIFENTLTICEWISEQVM